MNTAAKHIVIVGGGAGGAELATRLGNTLGKKKLAQITLIDANRTHIWKPRLHEVAAGMLDAGSNELSYVAHAHQHHFNFVLGAMCGIDPENKRLLLAPLTDQDEEIMIKVMKIIEQNMDNNSLSVESLGNEMGLNRTSFYYKIRTQKIQLF